MNRMLIMMLAAFGGGNVVASGALLAAGHPFLALPFVVAGAWLLGRAHKRLLYLEQVINCMYERTGAVSVGEWEAER